MSYLHNTHVEIIDHQFTINRKIEQMELRWLAEQTPSNGPPLFAAGLVRRVELVELSPPPFLPLARCPHHQRRFSWLLVRTPTTAGGRTNQHINISTHQPINSSTLASPTPTPHPTPSSLQIPLQIQAQLRLYIYHVVFPE